MENANYQRVIPRDFFNESKLLKCMGLLSLKILDNAVPEGIEINIDDCGERFNIALTDDGHLTISNYLTTINNKIVSFKSTYNSKENYTLVCEYQYEECVVFNDSGEFDSGFINFVKSNLRLA